MILATKLHTPHVRSGAVPREHVADVLEEGARPGGHCLVAAPAGFGKTTAVAQWLSRGQRPYAWLSLETADNDPERFWAHIVAALGGVWPEVGVEAESLLGTRASDGTAVADGIVNSVVGHGHIPDPERPAVLVLDDYHAIRSRAIHQGVDRLLDHLPPALAVVLATREDPPLSLARRRVRGTLAEIRAADLRFSPEEAAAFLTGTMGLALAPADVEALERRTEGWIASLHLAALSLQRHEHPAAFVRAFTGADRYVVDYLMEEVLAQQSGEVLAFLLATAGLDRFCASLCDAVLDGRQNGMRPAQEILEELEHANLFLVPLDGKRRWYRYHALFADLLKLRLRRDHPGEEATLHARASRWFEAHRLIDDAIRYALQAGDPAHAADLIEREGMAMLTRLGRPVPRRWLHALPEATVRGRPMLAVIHAWALLIRQPMLMADPHVLDTVEARLQEAEQSAQAAMRSADADDVRGHVRLCRAHLARFRGNVADAIRRSREELDRLPEGPGLLRSGVAFNLGLAYLVAEDGAAALKAFQETERSTAPDNHFVGAGVAYLQALILMRQGRLRDAYALCGATLERLAPPDASGAFPSYAGSHYLGQGRVLFEWDRLGPAEEHLRRGIEHVRRAGDPLIEANGHALLARVLRAQGDAAGAVAELDALNHRFPAARPLVRSLRLDYGLEDAWGDREREATVEAWAAEGDRSFAAVVAQGEWAFAEWLARGRQLVRRQGGAADLTQRERAALMAVLAAQAERAEAGGWMDKTLEVFVVLALAQEASDHSGEADETIGWALRLAQPEGYRRRFLNEGVPMARLLYRHVQDADRPDHPTAAYAARLLAGFPEPAPEPAGRTAPTLDADGLLIEPLSPRETEVLQLIARGLTNQEIADALFISYETVKVHARNVYQKLDVHGRTKAVARARALGLLSEPASAC